MVNGVTASVPAVATEAVREALPPKAQPWSLHSRLMWSAALATVFAWLTGGAGVLIAAHVESHETYDDQLSDVARVILSFAKHEIEEIRADGRTDMVHHETTATLDPRYAYQIWSDKGELLLRSHNAPRKPFAPLKTQGVVDVEMEGKPYCVASLLSSDGTMRIQVAEDEASRGILTPHLDLALLFFFVASMAILLALNRWLFGHAMRAIDEPAHQLTNRSPNDLRPLHPDNPPLEMQPLLGALNALFGRIQRTLDSERHFTAAAAHELRTPLAAIRMQAEVARHARSPEETHAALEALAECVGRASRMVDQLLTLARVESVLPGCSAFRPVRLDNVVKQVVRDLAPLFDAERIAVELQLEEVTLPAIEFGVSALVRNLLDNAARHGGSGRRIGVRTVAEGQQAVLMVDDGGPGIPVEERARVFERFYRLAESETDGCGVGMSIVQCVADAHHARVALDTSPLGGLRVTVVFPAG